MDGDVTRTGCRTGEVFCDVCRGVSRKRSHSSTAPSIAPGVTKWFRVRERAPITPISSQIAIHNALSDLI
jgi:hypothetical protein